MFRLRWRIEDQPRSKNGQPAHRTTGVANANSSQRSNWPLNLFWSGWPGNTSETMTASSGRVRATPIQRRRVMLANSGFAESVATTSSSSAIPQIGQSPGPSRSISGCMGQVYLAPSVATNGSIGSRAIPHFGHGPGFTACTSACIGQVYRLAAGDEIAADGSKTACFGFAYCLGLASNFFWQDWQHK